MIRCTLIVLCLLATSPAVAQDTEFLQAYLPERTSVPMGASLEEAAAIMQSQGYVFGDPADLTGGRRPVLVMATPNLSLVDIFMAVVPEMGSLELWNSSNVVLGFKDGTLTVMAETEKFPKSEAIQIFKENKRLLDAYFADDDRQRMKVTIEHFAEIIGVDMAKSGLPMIYEFDFWATPEVYTMAAVLADTDERGKTRFGKAKYFILHASVCDYDFLASQSRSPEVCLGNH